MTSTTSTAAQTYYQMGYQSAARRRRSLYTLQARRRRASRVPDLAESDPQISPGRQDGHGQDQAPASSSRRRSTATVTSKDVKYAIERGFFNTVNNGYAGAYFGDLEGAKVGAKPGTTIAGITTPDDQTIVFKLKRAAGSAGGVLAGALAMPLLRAGAGGVRGEVRREEPVGLRRRTRSPPART